MTITNQEFKEANARAKVLKAGTPAATSVHYDGKSKNIVVNLSTGIGIFFSPKDAQGLEDGMAARLGAAGGSSRSKPKAAAARANGSLGGRPRKLAAR
jgi:hypothetical protein